MSQNNNNLPSGFFSASDAPPPPPPPPNSMAQLPSYAYNSQAPTSRYQGALTTGQGNYPTTTPTVQPHRKAPSRYTGSGFKTVTIAVPGCKPQRFRICVGNRPEDIQQWIAERKKNFPRSKPVVAKKQPLASLLDGYDSSSASEAEEVKGSKESEKTSTGERAAAKPSQVTHEKNTTPRKRRLCKFFARNGKCRHGNECQFLHERPISQKRRRKTLLEKLLAGEQQREHELTIQLLRFIVDKNFLQNP